MRLGDINRVQWKQLNEDMKSRIGWKFDALEEQSADQVSAMLESTDSKIINFKTSKRSHELQNSKTYNGLLLAKQVLESYLSEARDTHCSDACCGSDVKAEDCTCGPNCKGCNCNAVTEGRMSDQIIGDSETMSKEEFAKKYGKEMADEYYESVNEAEEVMEKPDTDRLVLEADAAKMIDRVMTRSLDEIRRIGERFRDSGTLHKAILAQGGTFDAKALDEAFDVVYDEVETAHYDALGHHNVSEATPMMEDEVGEAEALMAAQDMVDRIQGMLEDVGEMLNEELPPLTDSLRRSSSADAAASFGAKSGETLNSLLEACRNAREAMANNVAALSGGEPTPMGDLETTDPDAEEEADLDSDIDMDDFETSDPAIGGDEPLGRSKRS